MNHLDVSQWVLQQHQKELEIECHSVARDSNKSQEPPERNTTALHNRFSDRRRPEFLCEGRRKTAMARTASNVGLRMDYVVNTQEE